MSYIGERLWWPIESHHNGRKKKNTLRGERDQIRLIDLRFESYSWREEMLLVTDLDIINSKRKSFLYVLTDVTEPRNICGVNLAAVLSRFHLVNLTMKLLIRNLERRVNSFPRERENNVDIRRTFDRTMKYREIVCSASNAFPRHRRYAIYMDAKKYTLAVRQGHPKCGQS